MFISTAFAQDAASQTGSIVDMFVPMLLVLAVFYFLLFRPQQKKAKEHQAMQSAVRRGDRIVTAGGIIGTITKVIDDNEVQVEISDGVKVRMQRGAISTTISKTEPVKSSKDDKDDKDDKADKADDSDQGDSGKSGSKGLKNLLKK